MEPTEKQLELYKQKEGEMVKDKRELESKINQMIEEFEKKWVGLKYLKELTAEHSAKSEKKIELAFNWNYSDFVDAYFPD